MKIVSKFKDYYDFVGSFGFDDKVTYIRKTESVKDTNQISKRLRDFVARPHQLLKSSEGRGERFSHESLVELVNEKRPYVAMSWVLGVLDSVYRIVTIVTVDRVKEAFVLRQFVAPNDAAEYLVSLGAFKTIEDAIEGCVPLHDTKPDYWTNGGEPIGLVTVSSEKALSDFLLEIGAPIWAICPRMLVPLLDPFGAKDLVTKESIFGSQHGATSEYFVKNPCLQQTGIAAIEDPTQLFQKLSMYVGAEFSRKEIPPISPESVRLEQRGFDKKQSFRHRK